MPETMTYVKRVYGNNSFDVSMLEYINRQKPKIKQQEKPLCEGVEVDRTSADWFQGAIHRIQFKEPRIGILFGTFNEDDSVTVDFIYEPPQHPVNEIEVKIEENKSEMDLIIEIAHHLGLKPVGWVAAHPRKSKKYLMTSWHVTQAAKIQRRFGKLAITIIVTMNKKKKSQFEAFQVSKQTVKLLRRKRFAKSKNYKLVNFNEPVVVATKEQYSCNVHYFLSSVPIVLHDSFLKCGFPIENRGPILLNDVLSYATTNMNSFQDYIRDPHFLLAVGKFEIFSIKSDFPIICSAIEAKEPVPEGYAQILKAFSEFM
eukprot:Anaeramoba_ignava/a351734_72.p1 GENE.a351734_72~~a351734_72.p1  ORF type:complete len:360 (+),score=110.58 a351734_72:140-1081(+)